MPIAMSKLIITAAVTGGEPVSRVKAFRMQMRHGDALELEEKVRECIGVVRRVSAGGSPEAETADRLERLLERWRSEA